MQNFEQSTAAPRKLRIPIVWDILLIGILLLGAYFRLIGLNWDQNTHMHPDERFLTMVATSLSPVESIGQYFDTATSSLNPNNRGYGFFVYGTLPMFIVRYTGELLEQTGYDEIHLVGRQLSALFDLGTVFLVYLIALRLFQRQRLALLASLFYALAVLPIQLSHYFKEDTFMTFFATLAVYFAVRVLPLEGGAETLREGEQERGVDWIGSRWRSVWPYALFGVALGMTVASKVIVAPIAMLLPIAALIRYLRIAQPQRKAFIIVYVRNLVLAAILAVLVFRIFQPYAFEGPGFFDVGLNPKWLDTMREMANQNSGDVDFPPQLQWARRPVWFGLQNIVLWGLGLPLGLLACVGFLWQGWRILQGEWAKLGLLWVWTALYMAWQSSSATPSMRYFMPVYPLLVIFAAWAVFALWNWRPRAQASAVWGKTLSLLAGVGVVAATLIWANAFAQIYVRPFTRVAASEWIFNNVPGPINLHLSNAEGESKQLLTMRWGYPMPAEQVTKLAFIPQRSGQLTGVEFPFIVSGQAGLDVHSLVVLVTDTLEGEIPLAYAAINDTFKADNDSRGNPYTAVFDRPLQVNAGKTYYLFMQPSTPDAQLTITDAPSLLLSVDGQTIKQPLPEGVDGLRQGESFSERFVARESARLRKISLTHLLDWEATPNEKTLHFRIRDIERDLVIGESQLTGSFQPVNDYRGETYTVEFPQPVELEKDRAYELVITFEQGSGFLAIYGSKQALESSWDDALPLGIDGYNPYDIYTGVFRSDLNFEMYWDDNPEKLARFQSILDRADYLFISSNRQWGTTVRVPERYPLTTLYYRSLLGCPVEKDITWCYAVAEPGMFQGALGFELIKTIDSSPRLGNLVFNTQFAEEAFTVYDHPKVFIFKKAANYDPSKVAALLHSVDLSKVVHLTPGRADSYVGNLLLDEAQLVVQRAGGTWSELFNREAFFNRYPGLAAVIWYVVISLLGWVLYPMVRFALRGLPDKGYPFVRMTGMLMLAYPVWLAGSLGVPFSRLTISVVAVVLVLVNLWLGWLQRKEIGEELRRNWRYFLIVEAVGLAFFIAFLLVRLGNSDLWHQWKGGEKPMDFSYFNAVLKSTTFPPYDPWFAGGYINYYYYGFVLVGVPVKWLGIVPSVAYNLILPQLFSLLALGAFSVVWNVLVAAKRVAEGAERVRPYLGALVGPLFLCVLGNLGSIRMIWHGLMRLAAPNGAFADGNIIQKIGWTVSGLERLVRGAALPYPPGDWYWIPSRAFPGEPITEFPAFTFLYADLHAHMIALPVTVLVIGWALSVILGRWRWGLGDGRYKALHVALSLFLGGLVIGTLRPTNTWDFYPYLALASAAIVFSAMRYAHIDQGRWEAPQWIKRLTLGILFVALLALLATLLYQPFMRWFGQAYTQVEFWKGDHTPWWSYITHWGMFLFIIVSWLAWESLDWMASTPVSSLNKLKPFTGTIYLFIAGLTSAVVALTALQVGIGWFTLPIAAWAGVLLLRPGTPDSRRAVIFMIGTGLVLTLMVELIVLRGDIGRMNTVFKFSLQAWTLLSLSAATALGWVFHASEERWRRNWRNGWSLALAVLVGCTALFPLLAGADKIRDRMNPRTPRTLDGMTYMAYSTFNESGVDMPLVGDYKAIRWMQDNVIGSPVIVEGHTGEYRWGNRYTINTGLPSVVGWNWHQRQQRALTPESWVTDRVQAIADFYSTFDREKTIQFLEKYDVRYIVVGVMERVIYPMDGLAKFDAWDADLWDTVYRDGDTVIYQVRQELTP